MPRLHGEVEEFRKDLEEMKSKFEGPATRWRRGWMRGSRGPEIREHVQDLGLNGQENAS